MNAIETQREAMQWGYQLLEMVMADVSDTDARWAPAGRANPIGALYAHALLGVDGMINGMLKGGAPRFATEWAGQLGPVKPQLSLEFDWGRNVVPNVAALRQYGQQAMADAEAYLSGLSDSDLDRVVDLSNIELGNRSVSWILSALITSHLNNMAGEISALKGLQGKKGYPF
jgi:hypothetical protein